MSMLWLFFALGTALCFGISSVIAKKILQTENPYLVALGKVLFAAPFMLPILFFIEIPALDIVFWKTVIILLPLEITTLLLYMKGIKESPVSLTLPFLSFTPVFMILTGAVILGETLSLYGILGIFFVVIGAYVLNIRNWHQGVFAPFKAIAEEKGSLLFLIISVIYAITSVLGKKAILHSSPLFFAAFYTPYMAIFLIPIAARKTNIKKLFKKPGLIAIMGVLLALGGVLHFIGISMIEAAYLISVKRVSMIVATVGAYLAFKEDHIGEHLLGAGIMLIGVVIITLLG